MFIEKRLSVFCILTLAYLDSASACATFSGSSLVPKVNHERAIIHWDPAMKTETFLRVAEFVDVKQQMGFVVPTPTVPKLEASTLRAFGVLEGAKHRAEGETEGATKSASAGAISILQEQTVGNFHATTIRASDARAFAKWLSTHHLQSRQETKKWAAFYVKKNWVFTAFEFRGIATAFESPAVKLVFKTDRPFYPYSEPFQPSKNRSLDVFFLSPGDGKATFKGAPWSADQSSIDLTDQEKFQLRTQLGLGSTVALRATEFIDKSNPRDGTDDVIFEVTDPYAQALPLVVVAISTGIIGLGVGLTRRQMRSRSL